MRTCIHEEDEVGCGRCCNGVPIGKGIAMLRNLINTRSSKPHSTKKRASEPKCPVTAKRIQISRVPRTGGLRTVPIPSQCSSTGKALQIQAVLAVRSNT